MAQHDWVGASGREGSGQNYYASQPSNAYAPEGNTLPPPYYGTPQPEGSYTGYGVSQEPAAPYYPLGNAAGGFRGRDPTLEQYGGTAGPYYDNSTGQYPAEARDYEAYAEAPGDAYQGFDQTYPQQTYAQYDAQGNHLAASSEQKQPVYTEYDQYGQPVQYDEQGYAYDYYGEPIQQYGDYYSPEQPADPAAAASYYDPYDPYNVQKYQQAPTVQAEYDPTQYPPVEDAKVARSAVEEKRSKSESQHVTDSKKKREKKKKRKATKQIIVTKVDEKPIADATVVSQKEFVVAKHPTPSTTQVVRLPSVPQKRYSIPPTAAVHTPGMAVTYFSPPTTVIHSSAPIRAPATTVITAPPGSYPRHHVILPPAQNTTQTVDVRAVSHFPSSNAGPPTAVMGQPLYAVPTTYHVPPRCIPVQSQTFPAVISHNVPSTIVQQRRGPIFPVQLLHTPLATGLASQLAPRVFPTSLPVAAPTSQNVFYASEAPTHGPSIRSLSQPRVVVEEDPSCEPSQAASTMIVRRCNVPKRQTIVEHRVMKLNPTPSAADTSREFRKKLSNRKAYTRLPKTPPEVYLVQSQLVPPRTPSAYHVVSREDVPPEPPVTSFNSPQQMRLVREVFPNAQTNNVKTERLVKINPLPPETSALPYAGTISPCFTYPSTAVTSPTPLTTYIGPQNVDVTPRSTIVTTSMSPATTPSTVVLAHPSHCVVEDQLYPPPSPPQLQQYVGHGAAPVTVIRKGRPNSITSSQSNTVSMSSDESFSDDPEELFVRRLNAVHSPLNSLRVERIATATSSHDGAQRQYMAECAADRLADENLRLQRDIAGLRRRLERTHEAQQAVSDLTIAEQNEGLRYQLRGLGKAIHDFSSKMPRNDDSAKLIEELAYQLNVALDDLSRLHQRLRQKDDHINQQNDVLIAERHHTKQEGKKLRKLLAHSADNTLRTANDRVRIAAPFGGVPYNELANLPSAIPEWYRSPIQADDIRHEMGLIDDLIGQCQRILAEATDNVWMVEYAVKDIMDQLFVTLRNKDAEDAASFPPDPAARQDFLQELRTTVDRHLTELFSTRNTLDRIQDQITNIKAHAWDPKRNIPYCSCRPRRDLLEDDVTHLMERLHEAGDQACQLRERLLGTELQNLALRLEGPGSGHQLQGVALQRLTAETKRLAEERQRLHEKNLILEYQLRNLQHSQHFDRNLQSEPARPTSASTEDEEQSPKTYAFPSRRDQTKKKQHDIKSPVEARRDFRSTPRKRITERYKPEEINLLTQRKTKRKDQMLEKEQKQQRLRDELLKDLDRYERTYLNIQKELYDTTLQESSDAFTGTKYRVVARMQQGAQQLRQLIDKIERGLQREEDLALAYSISADLRQLVAEAAAASIPTKMTEKEKNLLQQVQRQADRLLNTNTTLQKLMKRDERLD